MAICICKHTERKYFYIATYCFFFFLNIPVTLVSL